MPDYIFMLESRLSPVQLQILARVQQEAQELSLNIYLVGGAVRDLMTGSPIRDLDFAVEGNPLKLARRLQDGNAEMRVNESLRCVEMTLEDRVSVSVEMARSESYDEPGKASHVAPAPILEDLRRRDFSVNSMGISLTPGSRGLLLDPTNGLADVENRELRVLHNYSFVHDPVRLFRLVRFASRLGYRPEGRTQELFDAALERNYQRYISSEALGQEVEQIAREENVVAVLKVLAEKGLLEAMHPALQKRKPDYEGLAKFQKYRQQAEAAGYHLDPFVPALHYLTKRLQGGAGRKVLRKLALKKPVAKRVLGIEKEARSLANRLGRRRKISPREIYELLTPVPIGLLVFVLAEYSSKMNVRSKIFNYLFKYRPLRSQLPAKELQSMGVPPGPELDQMLEEYFEARLDGKIRDRAQQLRYLQKLAGPFTNEVQEAQRKKPPAVRAGASPRARASKAGRAKKRVTKAAKAKGRKASRNVGPKRKQAAVKKKKKVQGKARGKARR